MPIIGIYKITCLINNCIYIGQSIDIEKRWRSYNSLCCKLQRRLYRSFLKYGIKNHSFEIVEKCSIDYLIERETYWIRFYGTFNTKHGLNLIEPGKFGRFSDETKKRMSKSQGGRKLSEEWKKKISDSNKGKIRTKEQLLNQSISHLGKKLTKESIEKRTKTRQEEGYRHSDKTRERTRESVKKSWQNRWKIVSEKLKQRIAFNMTALAKKNYQEREMERIYMVAYLHKNKNAICQGQRVKI